MVLNPLKASAQMRRAWADEKGRLLEARIILADNQVIFRVGMARVLSMDARFCLMAQCASPDELYAAIEEYPRSVVVYPSSFDKDMPGMAQAVARARCRGVMMLEHGTVLPADLMEMMQGVVLRSVSPREFLNCLHRVVAGKRSVQRATVFPDVAHDYVGANLLERLTRKELQIIALVSEGWKNREIAEKLGTKEQVVKNYLCNIYDKTGVSDRLELALYTVHHRVLAQAAEKMRTTMAAEMAA